MSKRYGTLEERFWREVWPEPNSGCWLWSGAIRDGYGRFRVGRKKITVHRYAYETLRGPIPVGLIVRHKCDNPACVNPDHLEPGTHVDNVADMDKRGRRSVGENMPWSKLTEADIKEIRSDTRTLRAIAAQYGVVHSVICRIKKLKKWRHVR